MNEMENVWSHPQLKARGRWRSINTPAGAIPALIPPGAPGAYAPRMGSVPALGEHTHAILSELGLDDDKIARLRVERAI